MSRKLVNRVRISTYKIGGVNKLIFSHGISTSDSKGCYCRSKSLHGKARGVNKPASVPNGRMARAVSLVLMSDSHKIKEYHVSQSSLLTYSHC